MESQSSCAKLKGTFSEILYGLEIKSEVFYCIVEGDSLYDVAQQFLIVRILSVFYPRTDHLAKDTAEIIMSRIREEGTGIRQHSYKISEC